jgi:hypothetical protein
MSERQMRYAWRGGMVSPRFSAVILARGLLPPHTAFRRVD